MPHNSLTPAKVFLLAVYLASVADLEKLGQLRSQYAEFVPKNLLLRILLTYLPESVDPNTYVTFLRDIVESNFTSHFGLELDFSHVGSLSEQEAFRKASRLYLAKLTWSDSLGQRKNDSLTEFLLQRACKMDVEIGMLSHLPDLLLPFANHNRIIREWTVSVVLPYSRRNAEYYLEHSPAYTLAQFQKLSGSEAVLYLLSRTGDSHRPQGRPGRDFRGLVGPWLFSESHWSESSDKQEVTGKAAHSISLVCPGWMQAMEWLTSQASHSWDVVTDAVEQWNGPADVDLSHGVELKLSDSRLNYLQECYVRAVLASTYTIQKSTMDCLECSYRMCAKVRLILGHDQMDLPLRVALKNLPDLSMAYTPVADGEGKMISISRNNLLQPWNPLTSASLAATSLSKALILSACILTQLGMPCTVKRAGDLAFFQDQGEQRDKVAKLFHIISNHEHVEDDEFWIRVRREILWLHDWGGENFVPHCDAVRGVLASISRAYIETEFLKAILSESRYELARKLFDEDSERSLSPNVVQNVVFQAALSAFDNAVSFDCTKGELKRCGEIIHALPKTMPNSSPGCKQIQALLKVTHALGGYRLVFKQGELFRPAFFRVHTDPIAIIDKILEQNPKAYTRLQEFLEMGTDMFRAGILPGDNSELKQSLSLEVHDASRFTAEKRISAMCVEAALMEDDFETAYSILMNRLGVTDLDKSKSKFDQWSWRAALKAGQYLRNRHSQPPTHLGTASGNLELRHLEQRLECLAMALRISPLGHLQDTLKSFRCCEEQLDSVIKQETICDLAWNAADLVDSKSTLNVSPTGNADWSRSTTVDANARRIEEAPLSLIDLYRATAKIARKNITAFPSLQGLTASGNSLHNQPIDSRQQRTRGPEHFTEAATDTLVSGFGWLLGANVKHEK